MAGQGQTTKTVRPRRKPRRSSDDPEGAVKAGAVKAAAAKPAQKPKQVKTAKANKKAAKGKHQAPVKPAVEYHSSSEDEGEGEGKEERVEVAATVAEGAAATPAATAVAGPSRRKQLRRKKGKVFLEDKAGLLSLLDNVTASKDAVIAEKKEKEKARVAAAGKRDVSKKPNKRADDRVKALEAAKKAIVAKDKEKRRRRKGKPAAEGEGAPEKKERKKVGFA